MEKTEELERYIEELDILDNDRDRLNEQLKTFEAQELYEDDEEYNRLVDELTQIDNEVMCLERYIADLQEELGLSS